MTNESYARMEHAAKKYREAEEELAKAQLQSATARFNEEKAASLTREARNVYERAAADWRKSLLELTPALDLQSRRGA